MRSRVVSNAKRGSVVVSLHMPQVLLEALDELVKAGYVNTRSEAIRIAVFRFLMDIKNFMKASERERLMLGYR